MILIKRMQEQDADFVATIDNQVSRSPWDRNLFISCAKIYDAFVAVLEDDSIIGFGIIAIYSAINEAHILNLAVAKDWHGRGIGSQVLRFLIASCPMDNNKIFLEVNEHNQAAINLYKNFNFIQVGIRKNYYNTKNGYENALIYLLKYF